MTYLIQSLVLRAAWLGLVRLPYNCSQASGAGPIWPGQETIAATGQHREVPAWAEEEESFKAMQGPGLLDLVVSGLCCSCAVF